MITTIIIDDEGFSREVLRVLLNNISDVEVLAEFSSSMEAIEFLKDTPVDVIFLDIHMPNFSGFDFLDSIINPPKVIITTADKNKALEAYEYDSIVDYLVKPITQERLKKSVDYVSHMIELERTATGKRSGEFYIKVGKKIARIGIEDIDYVEANGDYIFIFKGRERFVVNSSLRKIAERLIAPVFVKVHRSYIVNIKKIDTIKDNVIYIDDVQIPLSKTHKRDLMESLDLL